MRSSIPLQNQRTQDWFQQPVPYSQRLAVRQRLDQLIAPPRTSADTPISTPSPDGRWRAEAVTDPATELQTWQVAGEVIRDVYPSGVAWTPDGDGFFYDRSLPYPGGHALYYHRAGTPQRQDDCVRYQPEHPERYYQPHVSPDGRWLAVSTLNTSACNLLAVRRTVSPTQTDSGVRRTVSSTQTDSGVRRTVSPTYRELVSRFVGRYDIVHWRGDELVLRAVEPDAANGQLIAFDLTDGARQTLLPPGDLPLLDAAPLGDGWVASYLNAGRAELRLLDGGGELREKVPLPGLGTVEWLASDPAADRLRFAYSDYARPVGVYTWQPGDAGCQPESAPPFAFDPADFITRAATVPSADGAPVPLFLAHRRDVTPANRPTLLTAYGGLGVALTPRFSAHGLLWMERGGIYASVCARGGGELGEGWHQAAVGVRKQYTFDDVLAAARWLATEGITSPARLGLWGASNGGLSAGACLTQQPELFGAVVIESGLLDMLDYHRLGRGAGWLAEYGDPNDPAQREVLAAYSPLHNIQPGRAYPPVLIATHQHDPRVGEGHSLAFAQALAAAQGGDAPILLRVHPGSGHGPDNNDWAVERLTFLAEHLGLDRWQGAAQLPHPIPPHSRQGTGSAPPLEWGRLGGGEWLR